MKKRRSLRSPHKGLLVLGKVLRTVSREQTVLFKTALVSAFRVGHGHRSHGSGVWRTTVCRTIT